MISQQVYCVEHYEELNDLYNSDAWKNSVAYDAPVIDPDETLKLLNELLPLVPADKNDYKPWSPTGKNWDKNAIFGTMQQQLKDLIKMRNLESTKFNCFDKGFGVMYYLTHGTNKLSSPDRDQSFGPNIVAYMLKAKQELLIECAELVNQHNSFELRPNELKQIEQLAKEVFPNGFSGTPEEFKELNDKSRIISEGIGNFLTHVVPGVQEGKSKKEFKLKFKEMIQFCDTYLKLNANYGFIDEALERDDVASFVLSEPSVQKVAFEFKVCKNISAKNLIEAVLSSAGYPNFKGRISSMISPYYM